MDVGERTHSLHTVLPLPLKGGQGRRRRWEEKDAMTREWRKLFQGRGGWLCSEQIKVKKELTGDLLWG